MLFIATCIDKPDSLAKRMGRRPAHLVYLSSLGAKVRAAGALLDPAGQNPTGSLLILETFDEAEARAINAATALAPRPSPAATPQPIASTFFAAPPISTPRTSVE